jgi:hypothetical protein
MLVELLARDPGLDDAIEILGVNREHAVHVAEIERDAAARRVDLAFQRSAGAERMTGTRSSAHSRTISCTSSVDCGNTTASGG